MTQAQTLTLAEFLLARIAEDEAITREFDDHLVDNCYSHEQAKWIAPRPTQARLLAECEAKRRLVDLHRVRTSHPVSIKEPGGDWRDPDEFEAIVETRSACRTCMGGPIDPAGGCHTLLILALPYAAHEDYPVVQGAAEHVSIHDASAVPAGPIAQCDSCAVVPPKLL